MKLPCPHCKTDLHNRADCIDDTVGDDEDGNVNIGSLEWERTITCTCGHEVVLSAEVRTTFKVKKAP